MAPMQEPYKIAKQFLQRYRAMRARYASLCREIEQLRESLTGTTVQLKADVVTGGGASDRMSATVAKMVDMEREISTEAAAAHEALDQVLAAIRAVPDETQRAVLTLRYVEGLGWNRIAERISYSERVVFRLHSKALAAVHDWMVENDLYM